MSQNVEQLDADEQDYENQDMNGYDNNMYQDQYESMQEEGLDNNNIQDQENNQQNVQQIEEVIDSNDQVNDNQIDSSSKQENQVERKTESFDPLGLIVPTKKKIQVISTANDDIDGKDTDAKMQKGEFVNNIQGMMIEVPSYDERKLDGGKNNVIFYKIIVGFTKNNKKWFVEKRYSEFDALDKTLRELYPNIQKLPGKTLFKINDQKQIEERKVILNSYLKQLINRRDMRTSEAFKKFLNFDNKFPESQHFEPCKIADMKDFPLGIRDFIYLPQYETGFVAQSDMNIISRIDSYFTNFNFAWEKKKEKKKEEEKKLADAVSTVGSLQHFVIKDLPDAEIKPSGLTQTWKTSLTWTKTFKSQTNIIHWCDQHSTLYCGLDNGHIHRYYCQKEKNLKIIKELPVLTVHNVQMRIMGLSVDPRVNHLFSISESGYLITTDMTDTVKDGGKFINSQCLSTHAGLKAMIHDNIRNLLFIACGDGKIQILNCLPTEPELIVVIETDQKVCIRGLTRSINIGGFEVEHKTPVKMGLTHNLLLSSDVNGYITIFDINHQGKEKLTKRVGNTQGKPKQRMVIWRDHGREIISGDEDGIVTFWYSKEGNPLFVFRAHNSAITQMRWNEISQQLITCGKDKTIKIWQLPQRWIDEKIKRMPQESNSNLPSDEDYDNFAKSGYVQDFKTGIDENIWASSVKQTDSSNYDKLKQSFNETIVKNEPVISESLSQPVAVVKEPEQIITKQKEVQQQSNQIRTTNDQENSSDEELTGWNK